MSVFSEQERLVSDAIDSHFGELTRLEPQTQGNYLASSEDMSRPKQEVTGIVDIGPVTLIAQDTGKYDGLRPSVKGERDHVSYDVATFTNGRPREGDIIALLDPRRSDYPKYRISRIDPDGLGRMVCVCTPIAEGKAP